MPRSSALSFVLTLLSAANCLAQQLVVTPEMAKFAASGFKRVDGASHRLRMDRCEPCEFRGFFFRRTRTTSR
ncbi:MAG: hypothetical protein ABSG68_20775 [Thermoguttaceae bacterium]|jgi:hypothetical protein